MHWQSVDFHAPLDGIVVQKTDDAIAQTGIVANFPEEFFATVACSDNKQMFANRLAAVEKLAYDVGEPGIGLPVTEAFEIEPNEQAQAAHQNNRKCDIDQKDRPGKALKSGQ